MEGDTAPLKTTPPAPSPKDAVSTCYHHQGLTSMLHHFKVYRNASLRANRIVCQAGNVRVVKVVNCALVITSLTYKGSLPWTMWKGTGTAKKKNVSVMSVLDQFFLCAGNS